MKQLIGTFLPTMTNGDRIRAMTDEGLAALILNGVSSDPCDYCKHNNFHCDGTPCKGKADADTIIEWLQQPANQFREVTKMMEEVNMEVKR